MAPSVCSQCGHPLPATARFCGQCGTLTPLGTEPTSSRVPAPKPGLGSTVLDTKPHPLSATSPEAPADRTMMGYDPTLLTPPVFSAPPRPSPVGSSPLASTVPVSPAIPGQPAIPSVKRTMLGGVVSDFMKSTVQLPSAPSPPKPAAPAPAIPPVFDPRKGTMIGVALPGIAPLAASAVPRGAMMGGTVATATPGLAPGRSPLSQTAQMPGSPAVAAPPPSRKAVEIAPRPPPLIDDEPDLGPAPQRIKRGVPFGAVAGIVAILVAAAGGAAFFFLRSPPLVLQPGLDAQGHEQLHIRCETCQDGTVAEIDGARATFQNKEADLPLASPLKVGNNPLAIHITRPKFGREGSVQVVVPVAFRIRADLSGLTAAPPAILVRVEAVSGTDVQVDGKPVALDASGAGVYATDIGSETEGVSDELRFIDRVIPYAVTPKSSPAETGKLTVRVGIAPLRLDAPGLHAVVESATFRLAGRTVRGGSVTVNGAPLHTEPDGTFAQSFDAASDGDLSLEVRASGPQLAPRTAHLVVTRVDRLADAARAREKAPEATYDDIAGDIPAAVGKATIVEGDVAEARTTGAQTIAIVDDARGCSRPPCLVRVTYAGDTRFKHGDVLRAYGRVTRAFAYGSSTVPEVEADFVQLGHAPR